jgi:hypothetical protein
LLSADRKAAADFAAEAVAGENAKKPDCAELAIGISQKTAATGLLVNREMQMRSLYRVAGSCN